MKYYLAFIIILLLHTAGFSQKLKSETYIFKYCDVEYHKCISTCKVVIKIDSITVYATKALSNDITNTKAGDIMNQGIILKHKAGKWIIGESKKDINAKGIGVEGPAIIDFKKKEYWTF